MPHLVVGILLLVLVSSPLHAEELTGVLPNERNDSAVPGEKLSLLPKVFVKRFIITGNSAIAGEDLLQVARAYTNREVTIEQLEELRQALNLLYVKRGYINSGVIIPDQQVADGVINLVVIEGKLTNIEITGLNHYRESYFKNRLEPGSQEILNLNTLQESLEILQQDRRIKRINADLQPGKRPGEAYLKVKVEEESPYKMILRFNNNATPSTGMYQGKASLAHRNLFGFGDTLGVDLKVTEGALNIAAAYTIPVTSRDTSVSLFFRKDDSAIIEEQFAGMNINSTTETVGVKIRQPLYRTGSREFALSLAGEYRESRCYLFDQPYSFSLSEHDGVARVSVLRLGQEFIHRGSGSILAIHSTFNVGLPVLGATTNDRDPDSRFFSWLGQLMLLSRIGESATQLMLKTNVQVAADGLLAIERFGLGGMNSVRGYRTNLLVRDNGLNSTLEFRVPVIGRESGWGEASLVPFFDFGWGWNSDTTTPNTTIAGVGGGIRWNLWDRVLVEAYYGYALNKVQVFNESLPDRGIYFQVTTEVF